MYSMKFLDKSERRNWKASIIGSLLGWDLRVFRAFDGVMFLCRDCCWGTFPEN